MIFGPRVGLRELASLCRRWATALEAGIDLRRLLERESSSRMASGLERRLAILHQGTARGETLVDSLAETGNYFPVLFREMVEVGEETGQLSEVFRQLAEHYEHQLTLRRNFLAALAWPAIQLTAAIGIVGVLILVMGVIAPAGGEPIDILGFGLVGTSGLMVYLLIVGTVVAVVAFVVQALRRGLAWTAPMQRLLMALPVLGPSLRTLALSRLAWSLHVTLDAGMALTRALPLSLRSTRVLEYSDASDDVVRAVKSGREISEALSRSATYPRDFLDHLEIGERSGRLPESMALLSRQYQEQAQRALGTLTVLAGFAVWALVAMLIIAIIFKLAFFYLGTINDALNF
jgi:type IV pilus assembly protein PilC